MFGISVLLIILLVIFILLLPLFALIDLVRSNLGEMNKIMWVLIILFMPIFGSILYFVLGRIQNN